MGIKIMMLVLTMSYRVIFFLFVKFQSCFHALSCVHQPAATDVTPDISPACVESSDHMFGCSLHVGTPS